MIQLIVKFGNLQLNDNWFFFEEEASWESCDWNMFWFVRVRDEIRKWNLHIKYCRKESCWEIKNEEEREYWKNVVCK